MQRLLRSGDIAFGIAVAFLLGIFCANVGWNGYAVVLLMVCGVSVFLFFLHAQSIWHYTVLFSIAFIIGTFYYHGYLFWEAAHIRIPSGKEAAFFGLVTDEPRSAGNFMMLTVKLSRPYNGTLDIFTSPGKQFNYGDLLWIRGTVDSSKDSDEPPVVFLPQVRVIAEHNGFWFKEKLIAMKAGIVRIFNQVLPQDQAALLAGIIIGTTNTVGAVLKDQMNTSGTSYIVTMYGYKIAVLTGMVTALLKDYISRRLLLFLNFVLITLFILTSGGNISALRAGIMGSVTLIAWGTGRSFIARNALVFTALGMVLFDPTLLTDAAFQLSFLSFLGIYYLGTPIKTIFHWRDDGILQWKEHAMLALSTNLAIIPIVMRTFGAFSITSFISNVLIMIPWAVVIFLGMLIGVLGAISFHLIFFVVPLVSILLRYELFVIHLFAVWVIPLPVAFGSAFSIIFYYGILILFAYYYGATSQTN